MGRDSINNGRCRNICLERLKWERKEELFDEECKAALNDRNKAKIMRGKFGMQQTIRE